MFLLGGWGPIAKYRFVSLLKPSYAILCFITFAHPTPLRMLRVGVGGGGLRLARVIYPPPQNDALDLRE